MKTVMAQLIRAFLVLGFVLTAPAFAGSAGTHVIARPAEITGTNVIARPAEITGTNVIARPAEITGTNVIARPAEITGTNIVARPAGTNGQSTAGFHGTARAVSRDVRCESAAALSDPSCD